MALSYSDMPPPRVKNILPTRSPLRTLLMPFWLAAQDDPDAYPTLKTSLSNGQLDHLDHHADLMQHVRNLQPPKTVVDGYTLEVLTGIWTIACTHPSALQEHFPGSLAVAEHVGYSHPLFNHHRSLAWSIYKLQKNSMHRLSSPNTSPISQLPVEILSDIFELLRWASPRHDLDHNHDYWDACSFLAVQRVCRRWRIVSEETTPGLWVGVVLGYGPTMTARALKNSKRLEISVAVKNHNAWNEAHRLVFEHLGRIRAIDIMSHSWEVFEQLPAMLRSSTAPHLSSLFLFPFLNFEGHRRFILTTDILQGVPPPNLREIDLLDCTIRLPSPLLPSTLISLRLARCHVWLDWNAMLDTLASLPLLENFKWCMGLNTISNTDSATRIPDAMYRVPSRGPVNLSRLQSLDLECPTTCIDLLLAHLTFPSLCRVDAVDDYTLTGVEAHDHAVRADLLTALTRALMSHLSRVFPSHTDTGYETIRVEECEQAEPGRRSLYIQGRTRNKSYPRCSVSLYVADERQGSIDISTFTFLLRGILRWPAMNTKTICFETTHPAFADVAAWVAVLDSLPRVSYLHLENSGKLDASSTVSSLCDGLHDVDVAPALMSIHVQYMSIPAARLIRVAEVARNRLTAGNPPIALCLDKCTDLVVDVEAVLQAHGDGAIRLEQHAACCPKRLARGGLPEERATNDDTTLS